MIWSTRIWTTGIRPQKRGRTWFGLGWIQVEVSKGWVLQSRRRQGADLGGARSRGIKVEFETSFVAGLGRFL